MADVTHAITEIWSSQETPQHCPWATLGFHPWDVPLGNPSGFPEGTYGMVFSCLDVPFLRLGSKTSGTKK